MLDIFSWDQVLASLHVWPVLVGEINRPGGVNIANIVYWALSIKTSEERIFYNNETINIPTTDRTPIWCSQLYHDGYTVIAGWTGLGKMFHWDYYWAFNFLRNAASIKIFIREIERLFLWQEHTVTLEPECFNPSSSNQTEASSNLIYISISQSKLNWENYPIWEWKT